MMRGSIFVLLCVMACLLLGMHQVRAQNKSVDEPLVRPIPSYGGDEIVDSRPDLKKVIAEGMALVNREPKKALQIVQDALGEQPLDALPEGDAVHFLVIQSLAQSRLGMNEEALKAARTAHEIFMASDLERPSPLQAQLLIASARASEYLGDMASALSQFYTAWAVFRDLEDSLGMANAHASGAGIYHEIGQIDNALSNYQMALSRAEEADDDFMRARIMINMAYAYLENGDPERALVLLDDVKPIVVRLDNPLIDVYHLENLAEASFYLGDMDQARAFFVQSRAMAEDLGIGSLLSNIAFFMAQIEHQAGNIDAAFAEAEKGLVQAQKNDEPSRMRDLHGFLADLFEEKGQFESALFHLKQSRKFHDEIRSTEVEQLGKVLEAQMDLERKEQQIALLKRDQEINELQVQRESIWRNIALSGALMLLTIILGLTILLRAMSKSRKEAEDRSRGLLVVQAELERANQTKSNILAMTSHEVRTPLNGIMGMAQVLQRTAQSPEQIRLIETIMTSSEMLLVILNDILDMSKIEAGRLDMRADPVLVSGLMEGVEDLWRPKAEEKGLALKAQLAPSLQRALIVCDGGRVRQILSNLLSNAIKFSSTGAIYLRAETDDEILGRSAIVFSVKDNGIGIPAGHGKDLFEPFTQLESGATRKYGGTGLGLSICKKLVDLMDGQIGYESEPGKGTRFWFAIPLISDANQPDDAAESAPQPRAQAGPTESARSQQAPETGLFEGDAGESDKKRILIAEDNPTNQIVIREMLRGQGYALDFAENGAIALEKLKAMPFDLVLMDVNMPVMNGVEAVAEIRRLEKQAGAPPLPVIAITADAFEEDRARLLANGMDDYISKPIDRLSMLDMLRAIFAAHGAKEKGEVKTAIG